MSVLGSWRVPLRLARREAARARARSALVLVMIALPVLAVTAADIALHTQQVDTREGLARRLGHATAQVTAQEGSGHVEQGIDPSGASSNDGADDVPLLTASALRQVVPGATLTPERSSDVRVRSREGVAVGQGTELDLGAPATRGLFRLTAGHWPSGRDEVVVNQAMLDEGYAVGKRLRLADSDRRPLISGVAESAVLRGVPQAAGPLGSLGLSTEGVASWYVSGAQVSWQQVRELNRAGALVLSRAVVLDPPPASQIPESVRPPGGGPSSATIAAASLVVVMALIEVVLLAGPAFAVGARRQARSLALMAASGGTPAQSRRVVLAGAVVLGGIAALAGSVLGIGAAALAMPLLQRMSVAWFGPFQVPWLQLVGIAAFGLVSALLAAVVPAWIASRQDVVAVLAGRRGDRRPSRRSPVLGVLLVAAGVGGAVLGATQEGSEVLIAGAAVLCVLGMVLLVPIVIAAVARVSRALPLSLRYAARDAARHRTRTVPAVAAVAATVAGVVTLGIALSSSTTKDERTYTPVQAMGTGLLTDYGPHPAWDALHRAVERQVPGTDVVTVSGPVGTAEGTSTQVDVTGADGTPLLRLSGGLGSDPLVSDGAVPASALGLDAAAARATRTALAAGRVVAFTDGPTAVSSQVRIEVTTYAADGSEHKAPVRDLPATLVHVAHGSPTPQAVVPTAVARELGLEVGTVALALEGVTPTPAQETSLEQAAQAISAESNVYVERGFQRDNATTILMLVLVLLGAVLMLGGTLTATFLALSDARADLATLSAIGASPRTRRSVAAAYAVVIGLVGAVLGAVIGFVPGLAVAVPLTRSGNGGPFLDVPWLLVGGLVLVLPLLTAAVVGVAARSRLPLVARLD